ncbi:hypothetical protein SUDANB96_00264 [Streptomyces sp. enrichment culture]
MFPSAAHRRKPAFSSTRSDDGFDSSTSAQTVGVPIEQARDDAVAFGREVVRPVRAAGVVEDPGGLACGPGPQDQTLARQVGGGG